LLYGVGEVDRPIADMIAGRRVGYQDNTTSKDLVQQMSAGQRFTSQSFARPETMLTAILNRDIDFAVVDGPFAADAQRNTRQRGQNRLAFKLFRGQDFPRSFPEQERYDEYAIAIRVGDELLPLVNDILKKFRTAGTIGKILASATREFEQAKGVGLLDVPEGSLQDPWRCPE
jgi:ABC-type amino acid transport substrate-binding protein